MKRQINSFLLFRKHRIQREKQRCFHAHGRPLSEVFTWALVFCSIFGFQESTLAQTAGSSDAFLDSSVNNAIKLYALTLGSNARLYNGSQYRPDEVQEYDTGHPYFQSDDWEAGGIHYDGQYYNPVNILYNLILDKIIIESPFDYSKIELVQSRISSFSLSGHDFVKLSGDSSSVTAVRSGFYDVLYDGVIKVYAKRSKEIAKKIESGAEKKKFIEGNRYFIYKKNNYFLVKSKASVLRVLEDQKPMLKQQIAKYKIVFKKDRGHAIAMLAALYDEAVKKL